MSKEEKGVLDLEISKLEEKLDDQYKEIGKTIVAILEDKPSYINHLVDEVIELKKKLAKAEIRI